VRSLKHDRQPRRNFRTMLIDLSHTIEHGMITYKGLPAPLICDFLSREASRKLYAPGTEFHIGRIDMVANTGTYLDSPFHRFAGGKDLAELSLDCLAGIDGLVVRVPKAQRSIDREVFEGLPLAGKAVLVQTNWDTHWRTDAYFEGHPFLTEAAAQFLSASGVTLVGSIRIISTIRPTCADLSIRACSGKGSRL
jgi:arylformamidase